MASKPICYAMERGDKNVMADVIVLPSGKCIVAWPTSVIVYDSERAARDVHIRHMGGRGEPTKFIAVQATDAFWRGWWVCYQDRCEGIPDASGPKPPRYIPEDDREDYEAGYLAMSLAMYGEDYVPDESKWQGDRGGNDDV